VRGEIVSSEAAATHMGTAANRPRLAVRGETRFDVGAVRRALVVGLAVTGRAVADAFVRRGVEVVAVDDRPSEAARLGALDRGIEFVESPDEQQLSELVSGVDVVVPSPGVPRHHLVYSLADTAGVQVVSEFDLAAAWDDRPSIAITGTNGKTTVTTLVTAMLRREGHGAVAAGNIDVPLVEAIDRTDDPPTTWFVVEASSFRLERATLFAPHVGAWLNLAPDHLDWHGNSKAYADAKARIWLNHSEQDVLVVPSGDSSIRARAKSVPGRCITFGEPGGNVRVVGGFLVADSAVVGDGSQELSPIVEVALLPRKLPHDLANAAAAAACALCVGVGIEAVRDELIAFEGLPHRMALIAEIDGTDYYDDSKATTPEATVAGLRGFKSAVLIAGGRNKGLDLGALVSAAGSLVGVVAIGESAGLVESVFDGKVPVTKASSMTEAVEAAIELGPNAEAIVLSPACASFDWYRNYAERGDDFARIVHNRASEHKP